MDDQPFVPGDVSPRVDAASDAIFPRELFSKPMAQMTRDELFQFMAALLEFPGGPLESDLSENRAFMDFVADEQEKLGNNGEPIQPEDCDVGP